MDMLNVNATYWYQITESRATWKYVLQYDYSFTDAVNFYKNYIFRDGEEWQIVPTSNNTEKATYFFRNAKTPQGQALGVCYVGDQEQNPSHTWPCFQPLDWSSPYQQWRMEPWGNHPGYLKITNVGNGTDYNLDCYAKGPVFMSAVGTSTLKGRLWEIRAKKPIENPLFQVSSDKIKHKANAAQSQAASTASPSVYWSHHDGSSLPHHSSSESSSSLSAGGAAGLAVAVTVVFAALIAALFFLFRSRRRHKAPRKSSKQSSNSSTQVPPDSSPISAAEKYSQSTFEKNGGCILEAEGREVKELPELPAVHTTHNSIQNTPSAMSPRSPEFVSPCEESGIRNDAINGLISPTEPPTARAL